MIKFKKVLYDSILKNVDIEQSLFFELLISKELFKKGCLTEDFIEFLQLDLKQAKKHRDEEEKFIDEVNKYIDKDEKFRDKLINALITNAKKSNDPNMVDSIFKKIIVF